MPHLGSLQIHYFGEKSEKCTKTCDPDNGFVSSFLMRSDLVHVTDSFRLLLIEAYQNSRFPLISLVINVLMGR